MPKQNKKLVGPYTVRVEVDLGWQNNSVDSLDEASDLGKRLIAKWQTEGFLQLRAGAYRFVNEDFSGSKCLKIFNAKDKLVTSEVLSA